MAQSNHRVVGDGKTRTFPVPFPYLNRTHVFVSIDGLTLVRGAWNWTSSTSLEMRAAPAAGTIISIYRLTPPNALVNYKTNTSALRGRDLDLTYTHSLYLLQERLDQLESTLRLPDGEGAESFSDAESRAMSVVYFDGAGKPRAAKLSELGIGPDTLNFRSRRAASPAVRLGDRGAASSTLDLGVRP